MNRNLFFIQGGAASPRALFANATEAIVRGTRSEIAFHRKTDVWVAGAEFWILTPEF